MAGVPGATESDAEHVRGMSEITPTRARRQTYQRIISQLRTAPSADFLAHAARMAPLGYRADQLIVSWAEREAATAHPIADPDHEIVWKGEVCKAAGLSYSQVKSLGAMDDLNVPGIAQNMTTRDAIRDWCRAHGIEPRPIITGADERLLERAAALVRVINRAQPSAR